MPRQGSSGESSRGHRRRRGGQRSSSSRSRHADLTFSVSFVEHLLREGHYAQRLNANAPVFLAAVLEYLTIYILDLARSEAQTHGQGRITPQFLDMVIHNNPLLSSLFRMTTVSQVAPPHQ